MIMSGPMRICQLSLEGAECLAALKLDMSRAFDTISRSKLAAMLVEELPDYPQACRCLLAMPLPVVMSISTPLGHQDIVSNAGVEQGAVESPAPLRWKSFLSPFWTIPKRKGGFARDCMISLTDDAFLWSKIMSDLQTKVNQFVSTLDQWGLKLNVSKCQLLSWGHTQGRSLNIGQLKSRIQLLYKMVWQSMSWVIGASMPAKQTAETFNVFLCDCVLSKVKLRRRPGETWVDHRTRPWRIARAWISNSNLERWSTFHFRQTWRYAGNRARGYRRPSPTAASILTFFRTPAWLEEQQLLQAGARHGRRH